MVATFPPSCAATCIIYLYSMLATYLVDYHDLVTGLLWMVFSSFLSPVQKTVVLHEQSVWGSVQYLLSLFKCVGCCCWGYHQSLFIYVGSPTITSRRLACSHGAVQPRNESELSVSPCGESCQAHHSVSPVKVVPIKKVFENAGSVCETRCGSIASTSHVEKQWYSMYVWSHNQGPPVFLLMAEFQLLTVHSQVTIPM